MLFADAHAAHEALSFGGGYPAAPNVGLLGSHGNAALPLAATLLAWGRDGVAARIDADIALADHLGELVLAAPELELWRPPVTGVVNWRPREASSHDLRDRLHEAWVSVATVDGETWLRSVAANPRADPAHIVRGVRTALGRR